MRPDRPEVQRLVRVFGGQPAVVLGTRPPDTWRFEDERTCRELALAGRRHGRLRDVGRERRRAHHARRPGPGRRAGAGDRPGL